MKTEVLFSVIMVIILIFSAAAAAADCSTGADQPANGGDCDGAVSIAELMDYIGMWYSCSSCHPDMFQAIEAYYGMTHCTPDCTGKECGDDGCGGSCGDCGSLYGADAYGGGFYGGEYYCDNGRCVSRG